MTVSIRPATREDAQQIADIVTEVRSDPHPVGLGDVHTAEDVRAWLDRIGDRGALLVIEDERQMMGFASVDPAGDDADECQFGAWVRPRFRRQGHATVLAEEALALARELGYRKIRGRLPDQNEPALSFLSSIGALVPFLDPGATFELPLTEEEEGL